MALQLLLLCADDDAPSPARFLITMMLLSQSESCRRAQMLLLMGHRRREEYTYSTLYRRELWHVDRRTENRRTPSDIELQSVLCHASALPRLISARLLLLFFYDFCGGVGTMFVV